MKKRETLEKELVQQQELLQQKRSETRSLVDDENVNVDDVKEAMGNIQSLEEEVGKIKSDIEAVRAVENMVDVPENAQPVTDAEEGKAVEDKDANEDDQDKKNKNGDKDMKINPNNTRDGQPISEERSALNDYLHSKGEIRDGVKSSDVGVVIPEEIIYDPQMEVNTVTDLSSLVEKTAVNTASGKYPILKRASTGLPSVDELEKNPELAKPQFENVAWSVKTYRGALPLSQESIADAAIDLTALVSRHINNIKVNTTNNAIAKTLSQFAKGKVSQATLVDDLKTMINTQFDVAYSLTLVITKSMYDLLDHAKDGEGRYLLQDQIGTQSGKTLFGLPVVVVEDTAFGGKNGSIQAFIGDLKRAVLFADRLSADVNWVDNDIYGKVLQAVIRFDVQVADKEAGRFVDIVPTK